MSLGRAAVVVPLLAVTVWLVPAAGRAYCRTTTVPAQPDPLVCPMGGVPISWEGGCTSLRIIPTLLPSGISLAAFQSAVSSATDTWAGAACQGGPVSFRLVEEPPSVLPVGYFPDGPNANTISFRNHWADDSFHPVDAAAVTVVTFGASSARILDADTEINLRVPGNPSGFVFSLSGDPDAADLPTIVTHELGHTQGLAHSAERSAVMWYAAGRGEQRRSLTPDDTAAICSAYPPGRHEACLPDLRSEGYGGAGIRCAARPTRPGTPWWVVPGALVALGAAVRRTRQRRSSSG